MKTGSSLLCLTLFAGGSLLAQAPAVNAGGVVNAASYAYAGLPSAAIGQGSIFAIFGTNLGPASFAQSGAYPIPTTLGGVTVRVTSGATSGNAFLFLASAGQITAMLPSNIAPGTASLTVTTGSGTSAASSFQVAASSFGTFAANSGGSGPGVITNANYQAFGLNSAANPGEAAVIWGTGLGPVTGNEAGGALPGDTTIPVEVYVGATKASVTYRGRSGCCAGLDQIVFTVPAATTGCRVPVTIKINSTVSNNTTMAIAPAGMRTCADAGGPSTSDLQKYQQNGAAVGVVALARVATTLTVPFVGTITTNADLGSASFARYTPVQLDTAANPFNAVQVGACTVAYTRVGSSAPGDPVLPKFLDAGAAINVSGAGGQKPLPRATTGPYISYSGLLGAPTVGGIGGGGGAGYLDPGTFSISGPGGPDVGAFTGSLAIPASLNWTNFAAITDVTRASGQQVTWTGGDPNGSVVIVGTSSSGTDTNAVGASYNCYAKGSDGSFTIPAQVLLAMPVSVTVQGVPTGTMAVGNVSAPKSFSATGLDAGYLFYTNISLKTLNYR